MTFSAISAFINAILKALQKLYHVLVQYQKLPSEVVSKAEDDFGAILGE